MSDKETESREPDTETESIEIKFGPLKGVYKVHLMAKVFPRLTGDPFNDLRTSIDKNGQQEPVVIDGDVFLDGRNRVAVLNDLAKEPWIVQFTDLQTGLDQGVWIAAKNLERRHLTSDQYLAISARCYALVKEVAAQNAQASPTTEEEAAAVKTGNGGNVSPGDSAPDDFPQVSADNPPTPGKRGRPPGQRSKAEALAVDTKQSRYRAEQILKVRSHSPELAVAVEQGRMALKEAAAQIPKNIPDPNQAEGKSEKPERPPDTAKIERAAMRASDKSREFAERLRKCEKPLFWQQIIARAQAMLRFETYAGHVESADASSVPPVTELEEQ
jgi:ParB-like chromosome segregation protein Spo0J